MANNKMLIDASHREETRVVVLRSNRIEEFDFESQNKKQIKGNIYLAKVMRVEPSLQAAFIDYGGNRHGFLTFNEIHPDYYQIPIADRQALVNEEKANANREEVESDVVVESNIAPEPVSDSPLTNDQSDQEESDQKNSDLQEEVRAKSKRRTQRPRKETIDDSSKQPDVSAYEENVDGIDPPVSSKKNQDSTNKPAPANKKGRSTSIAAMMETDSISESLPDDESVGDNSVDNRSTDEESIQNKVAAPPKRRRSRANNSKKLEKTATTTKADAKTETMSMDTPDNSVINANSEEDSQKTNTPSPRRRRRSSSSSKKSEKESVNPASPDDDDNKDDMIEFSGGEDALEEVPEFRTQPGRYKIQEVIKRRQILLVQVVKEERGNKGAALTTYLSLAGRYSVLMPNTARGGGISRKITNVGDRKRLKAMASELEVPEGMGMILRTAGANRSKAEIQRDFDYLMRLWESIRNLTLTSSAPRLIYEEGSLIKRSIRDLYDRNIDEVLVAGEAGCNEAQKFMKMLMPNHTKKVKLYDEKQAIFSRFGVEQQLDTMLSQQVTLKSGGYLVIDQTEALVAIDVNSGRATRKHSVEDTALQTNLEAAEEAARQLKLRDLAGLIIIDFIDMEEKNNNRAVEKKLKECLKNDRARIQIGRISHFGLMEMSRQRMRSSVLEISTSLCPHCQGKGHMRSKPSVSLHILRSVEEHLLKHSKFNLTIKTTADIAFYMLNQKRKALTEVEERFGLAISIESGPDHLGEEFSLEKGEPLIHEPAPEIHIQAGQLADEIPDVPAQPKNEDDSQNNNLQSADVSSEKSSEEQTGKHKRHRGKRAGQRTRKTDNSVSPTGELAVSPSEEKENIPSLTEKTDSIASPVIGKRGSRPKKAKSEAAKPSGKDRNLNNSEPVVAKKSTKENSENSKNKINTSTNEQSPRVNKRRTTRRRNPAATNQLVEKNVQEGETLQTETSPQNSKTANSPSPPHEADEKNGSWWNRGGFFKKT